MSFHFQMVKVAHAKQCYVKASFQIVRHYLARRDGAIVTTFNLARIVRVPLALDLKRG